MAIIWSAISKKKSIIAAIKEHGVLARSHAWDRQLASYLPPEGKWCIRLNNRTHGFNCLCLIIMDDHLLGIGSLSKGCYVIPYDEIVEITSS